MAPFLKQFRRIWAPIGFPFCFILPPFWLLFRVFFASRAVPGFVSGFCRQLVGLLGRLGAALGFIFLSIWPSFFYDFFYDFFIDFLRVFQRRFGSVLV